MRNSVKFLLGLSALGTLMMSACSQKTSGFLPQVAGADHVIVTDWAFGSRLFLTGQEAEELIRAVSSAEGPPAGSHLATTCSAEFYRKTNLLARIYFEGGSFGTNPPEFVCEKSGKLGALEERLERDKPAQTNWIEVLVKTAGEACLTNLQVWREEVLRSDQTKQVIARELAVGEGRTEVLIPAEPPGCFARASRELIIPPPEVYVLVDRSRKTEIVLIGWGYQYGFVVGPTTGYLAVLRIQQITNCALGICAFHRGNSYL
jgi:hypothetical protein